MATPRRTWMVDVTKDRTDDHLKAFIRTQATLRRNTDPITWVWCRHVVRATSKHRAQQKAMVAHAAQCQDWQQIIDSELTRICAQLDNPQAFAQECAALQHEAIPETTP